MKTFKKLTLLVVSSGMLITSGILAGSLKQEEKFIDPITDYAKEPVKYQFAPKYADDEDQPVAIDVNKVTFHYHNDDGKCGERAFYFWDWTKTVAGKEYNGTVTNNGKDMSIEIDFTKDAYSSLRSKFGIYLIVKYKGTWNGQSDDTTIAWSDFPPNDNKEAEVWMVPGIGSALECYKTEEETKSDKVTDTYFSNFKKIHVQATAVPDKIRIYSYDARYLAMGVSAQAKNKETRLLKTLDAPSNAKKTGTGDNTRYEFDITLNYTAHINMQYVLETEYPNYEGKVHSINIPMHKFYSYDGETETKTNITRFDKYYTYAGSDLGVTYTPEKSVFKVWAPTAGLVKLNIYDKGTSYGDDAKEGSDVKDNYYNMVYMPGGIWACELEGDLNGKYYTYTVYNSLGKNEVVDPYAKACGANGKRGMILDFSKTNPTGWDTINGKWDGKTGYDITTPQQLAIYEAHVRDLTMHSTWNGKQKPGTYLAFAESGTTYTNTAMAQTVKTGFDHLDELGVNAIQFTPVYDHDNTEYIRSEVVDKDGKPVTDDDGNIQYKEDWGSYNWGYNPLNYNCVEGQYSSDPNDGEARVKEFKQMIYALATNSNHTRTIMDVVYNHVSSAPNSNFTKLMPRYYFRYTDDTKHWDSDTYTYWKDGKKYRTYAGIQPDQYFNGSGCSNEVKTEAKMMRKFIVDSLCWWAKEYNVKGFRFDLMGLIDVETLKLAAKELYKIDPDIYMYGEGWTGDGGEAHVDKALYNAASGDYKSTWGANTYCTYRDLKKTANSIYVGAFNDTGRNAIRGGNDRGWDDGKGSLADRIEKRRPGWGFMSQDAAHAGENNGKVQAMMLGDNSGCDATKASDSARQTVNYASCHDNYALFDQFSATLATKKAYSICRAVTATNIAIMLSNGVGFMQGGEELYRTKIVADKDKGDIRLPEDYVTINGINIAHNAYKSPDSTNAFDWSRKISVNYGGETCETSKLFFDQLAKVIKQRTKLAYKASPSAQGDPAAWQGGNAANSCYFIGVNGGTNRGYAMLLCGEVGDNSMVLDSEHGYTYAEFAKVGIGSLDGHNVTSSECYSVIIIEQNPAA